MTLNDILKDPNYQGLPEAERRKVWHKLFDLQYGSDPNFMGLPQKEQHRARDMYADRVMGSEPRQVPTAAPSPRYMRKEDHLRAEQSIAKIKEQNEKNLGVSLNPRLIDDTLSNLSLTPNDDDNVFARVRRDIKFSEPAVADATQSGQQEVQSELDKIKRNAEARKRTFTLETEYQDNDARLRELSIKRGDRRAKSGEYQKLLQRQAEIEISYPRIAMGMNEDQYKAFELGRRFIKEHPALSYIDAFAVGLVNLSLGAGKMLMPGARGFDYLTYYEQGVASEGSTVGNLVRGTVSSLPTNIAMMANPTLAIPLTFADITSREVKEYYDEGALDAQAYFASAVSGVVQTAIEYMSDTKQLDIAKDALRKHGAQAAQDSITKSVRQRFFPTMDTLRRTLHAGAMSEAAEEVFQGVASVAINHVINGKPLPDADEFARELALSAVGGYLGGFLMGGGATGVQIYQHNEVAKYIQHNAQSYESIQMLQQSIDIINNAKSFNDIDTASDLLREAKAKAVKEGVEHPRLLQGFNLASSAIMASRANQVQAIKAANKEKAAEITELKQKADAIRREGFEPGFETEQGAKLYDLEDQIKAKEREYKKGLQQIHSNKELEMMGEALDRMDIEMAQLHAESAGMPYDAEYDPSADQGKEIKSPVMMEGRRRETMPVKKAAPIESKQEGSTSSSEPVPVDSNTAPSQAESTMPAEPANTENDKITSIKLDSETKQSKSLTIGKINEDVDRADPKESKRIPEESLGGEKTVVKGRGKGSKHKIRHALISLKDILVSHDADFNENKDYPQELQPRDRSKGASRAKNNQVTAELDPYRLMDNYLASEGRPIVVIDKDGRIIALTGNGRLIALKRRAAGEYDGIQEYEQTLREHLEDFGFNDQDTAGKVLVGVYYGDADLIQLANAMNESEGDAMSPVEQAAADAKQIANLKKQGDDIIEALDVNTEDVMSAANTGFLKLFAERLGLDITKYQTADDKWNKDFRTRVENALFMYIFSNNESAKRALSAWREDETSNMKSLLTGVMNSIKLIAKYRNAVEKYKTVDLDITVDLLEAIDVITRLRKEGKTLEQEANEMDLFSDGNEAIPSDKLSLYQAIAMIKTIKRGTEFIKGYYSEAMDLADPNQMSFLYDPNTSKEDFLNQYTEGFIKINEKKKDDRSPAQRSATETPATPHGEDREGSRGSNRSEEDVVSGRRLRTGANESRLNSIPDSVAEDALIGLFKSHIAKTEKDGRKLTITFKDGRKLTLDRLNKNFQITMPDGRKLDMYGRTYSKTIDGTFNVFMDLVDGLNGGNRTLYHEAFHVAWKLFMTTEQIDMISRYYAKKLGPEASIVDIEEAAANAAQNWLGNRAEVPPGFRNIFRRFWDRVRHALVSLGLANENQKIEDIFWGLEQDRLSGKGTEDRTERHRFAVEESTTNPKNIINPIDKNASNDDKLAQIKALREEASPVLHSLVEEIKNTLSIDGKTSDKSDDAILEKAKRPEILKDKPWHGMEHLRDVLRAKVILSDPRQIVDIARIIEKHGVGVVKFDVDKLFHPKEWGFRIMSFDLRMPNGLITELYTPIKEIEAVKKDNHKLYEKWRDKTEDYKKENWAEYSRDVRTSNAVYNNAFSNALSRLGISQDELKSSLMNSLLSLGLSQEVKFSKENAGEKQPGTQVPSSRRLKGIFNPNSAVLPSGSYETSTSDNFISTSSDKISQSSDNATFSQGKSLVADIENLNNETEVRYRLESGDNKYAFNVMDGYKPSKTVKGYKAFVRDKDGNLKPLFVSNDITIPVGKWLEAKDTWHFQAANGLYYVPTGGEDVDAKKSKKKKDEKKTGENVPIPNEKVRAELIKRGFLPKGSKAMSVKAVAYRPGWHGSLLPLAKQLGNQTASISRNTGTSFDGYDYSNVYQEDIVFAEVEFDMSNDYQGVASKETGLQRMPEKGGYQFTTNKKNEDPKNPWFISGAIKVGRVLDRSEVNELVKKAGLPIKKWRDDINTSKGEGVTKDGVRYRLDKAYHGSGALFNRFDVEYIGTGEGAQAFGWGIYVTENERVARDYATRLGAKKFPADIYVGDVSLGDYLDGNNPQRIKYSRGLYEIRIQLALSRDAFNPIAAINRMIEVEVHKETPDEQEISRLYKTNELLQRIKNDLRTGLLYTISVWENHQEDVLDWMGNLTNEQIEKINKAIKLTPEMSYSKIEFKNDRAYWVTKTYAARRLILSANDLYGDLSKELGSPKAASQFLLRAGIDGIKYPVNAMSGGTGNKGYNYVVFDDSQITIQETTRYRAVEEKNLVTIHNLEVDNLEKTLSRGGMPMPSIAIVDIEKTNHKEFGDVSLIASPEILDVSRKNPVYTQDAWTPNHPSIIHEVARDSWDQLKGVVKEIQSFIPDAQKSGFAELSELDLEQNISNKGYENALYSYLDRHWDNKNSADTAERDRHHKKARRKAKQLAAKYPVKTTEMIRTTNDRNGNARYVPNTLENVMKHMERQRSDDSSVHNINHLIGKLSPKLTSVSQIQKNRGRLTSKEGRQDVYNRVEGMIKDLVAYAKEHRKQFNWWEEAQVIEDLYDIATKGLAFVRTEYKQGTDFSKFFEVINEIKDQPSDIFEAKPRRAIKINEFSAAVIPTGTKASTAKALRDAGLKVVKYKAGDNDARYEAVKKVSEEMGVRFRAEQEKSAAKPKLVKTEWRSKLEDVPHKIEGSIVARRSDWDKSLVSELSGREIVHVYWIDKGDGEVKPYGIQSAAKIMGWSKAETGRKMRQLVNEHKAKEADIKAWRSEAREYKGAASPRAALLTWEPLQAHKEQDFWAAIDRDFVFAHKDNTYRALPKNQSEHIEAYRREGWDIQSTDQARGKKPVPARQADTDTYSNDEQMEIRFRAEPSQAEIAEAERQMAEVRAKYEGTDQWLKAPNGKPTNLNERQWLQVRTQNFKDWFGDWENDPKNASKVVDENGEPMVMYHGTIERFNAFDHRYINDRGGNLGFGFYFGTKPITSVDSRHTVMAVFLNARKPIKAYTVKAENLETEMYSNGYENTVKKIKNKIDSVIDEHSNYGIEIMVFSPTQIKSATANVGTFDPQNPDIRYRIEDPDLDARLKRAHEMLKKYKANVDPKEASKKIATEIAKAKNLDPSQADEKIGRMIRAAYREGEGKAKESLAAFGIAETEAFIQTNKPDGTDKQDLTFHMEEALEYAADMGLSEADVKNLGADRFTYYLQGLNMYAYGNALTQQLNDKYAEKQALAAKGITDEALDQEISDLISLVADARLKYENMKGAAGRLLQHARWEKSNRIKDLIKIAEVITETRDAQIAEINAIEAEMAELNTMLTELEKEFELLLDEIERLSGSRYKSDSIDELRERKRLMAEQRSELKNRMEVLKHRLTKAREGLQTSEKQNRAIREQLDKAGQIEFTEEEQNILKQIVESGVLNEEQLEAIGTTMKTGFRPTATGLKAIAPLTGSTSDLTPKQAALIQKILDHGKKPPTVTEFPLMDADWVDVVSNAFYQIILSSPVTHARNIIGNEANLALENIVNTVLGRDLRPVINSILSAKEGVRNTKEAWKHAEAYMKKYNLDVNSRIMKRFTAITRALAAEDAFYYSRNYAAQITSIAIAEAKRTGRSADYLLRNPSLAMIKQAEYEASRGTWNYDPEGILGYVTKAIETGIGMAQHGGKLGKISALLFKMNVVPFTRVVANVLNTALDWSPVGYLGAVKYATGLVDKEFKLGKGVTIRQRKVWTDEKGNAIKSPFAKRDATRQLARATMGTIMLSLAYMLLEGIISGAGPDDWEKRKQMMETGWRPNSIKIAGRWHSYMMLPIAPMLSAIANFQERRRKPGARAEEVLAATVMGMANTILDQSFLSNLAQLMEAITGNNHRYLIRAAADTPTRVIPISPNLLRVIADAVNDKAYAPETFIQYLMYSGRPWTNGWIKDNIPARIDVFGREAKKTSSFRDFPGSPVMDGQPLYVYDKNDIPHDMRSVLNTILGAGLKIPSTNAYEARVGDDQFIKLKGFDKEQFLRQRGFYLSMGLLSYQNDIEYLAKEGDIDAVKDILQKIATRATRDAKREMIYRYIDGEMRHKYSVYSKSRNRRKDEED